MQDTARKALVASLIVVAVVASALALWKLRIVLALLFLALIIAASMRPSVEALARRHIPRRSAPGFRSPAECGGAPVPRRWAASRRR